MKVRSLLAVGLIAATFGNLLLLSGCKSMPVIATALMASTAADYVTTYRTLDKCKSCSEANPIMAPLIPHKKTLATVQVSINVTVLLLALRDKRNGYKYWYVGPWILTGVHAAAAANNELLARKAEKN